MKNTLIGLLIIFFFSACVQKYDICENPKITGDFIVKDAYPDQDSVRISTKNIRINNKTITEFKNLAHISSPINNATWQHKAWHKKHWSKGKAFCGWYPPGFPVHSAFPEEG